LAAINFKFFNPHTL